MMLTNSYSLVFLAMLRILIADDHEIVRRGLKQILQEEFPFVIIEEAADTATLISKAVNAGWDIILSDLAMPGGGGLDALLQIRKEVPHIPVLILSIYPEEQYALRLIRAGAAGYMNKDAAPEELVTAVQQVLSGKKYITAEVAEQLSLPVRQNQEWPLNKLLSEREYDVFLMIVAGHSIAEIAEKLLLSATTVSTYRSRILGKMNLKNNAGLIQYAMEHKIS
jgi:DNA-binding NarL/FixJ family response regulator